VSDSNAPQVCLVDDDSSVRKSLARVLESAGYRVNAFDEPQTFLEYLARHRVLLVVLDVWMERMSGMELLAHLCAWSPRPQVIFITGHEDHAAEATVRQAGAFAFFIKPFDNAEFLAAVGAALNNQSLDPGDAASSIPTADLEARGLL